MICIAQRKIDQSWTQRKSGYNLTLSCYFSPSWTYNFINISLWNAKNMIKKKQLCSHKCVQQLADQLCAFLPQARSHVPSTATPSYRPACHLTGNSFKRKEPHCNVLISLWQTLFFFFLRCALNSIANEWRLMQKVMCIVWNDKVLLKRSSSIYFGGRGHSNSAAWMDPFLLTP